MNGYITVQEAAVKWGITPRQVQILCKENRIDGATRMSRIWIIPENAKKPTSEIISNLKVLLLSSRNKDNTDLLEQQYQKWEIFFKIMKNYVIITA